jgi:hypothetical protein
MIRTLTIATHFAAGFVSTSIRYVTRIAVWTGSVAILGALVGIHPITAVLFVIAMNLLATLLYPLEK